MRAGWEHADVASSSDAYARRFSGPIGEWFLDVQARHTMDLIAGAADRSCPLRVLDVGGGHGQLTPHLLAAGHDVTVLGSDETCGSRIARWTGNGRCRFEVGDPADLPCPDAAFDVVLAFRMLPHVADWQRFLDELCRVARRAVVLDYPSTRSVNIVAEPLFALKLRVEKDTRPFRRFSPGEIAEAFRARGFEVTARRGQYLLPMALYRALRAPRLARAMEAPGRWAGATDRLGSPVIVRADRG